MPLADFNAAIWQGVNGPIWALIALDSNNYEVPINPNAQVQSTRELFISEILRRQTPDGGWNLTAGAGGSVAPNEVGDPGLTGMALQALARYDDNADVYEAIQRALSFLSRTQTANGGFSSTFSGSGSDVESAVQVLVALTTLGISLDDTRFVKNGNSVLDNVLSFAQPNGSFLHSLDGGGDNQMSTEQAFYGLVAAQRAMRGQNSLYDMTDVNAHVPTLASGSETKIGLAGRNPNVTHMPIISPDTTFYDIAGHSDAEVIEALAARGIIGGMSATSFAPDATMTRAQFAAIITRALGLPTFTENVFSDVPDDAWFASPVATAYHFNLVSGTSPTTFNPNGTITIQEAAVMVARAVGLLGLNTDVTDTQIINVLAPFGDGRLVAPWARSAAAFVLDAGILDDTEFYLRPTQPITRAHVATMVYRMLDAGNML
jgi:hypothetical protein